MSAVLVLNMATPSSAAGPTSEEGLSKLESQVTCAICLDRYTDPRTLQCLHSYCKGCIGLLPVELDRGRHLVRCPSCRVLAQLSEKGAAALPTAFLINSLLEIHQLLKKTNAIPLCHIHKDKLDIYCETCEEHVCFKCSTGSHRDHQCERAESLFKKHKQEVEECRPLTRRELKMLSRLLIVLIPGRERLKNRKRLCKRRLMHTMRNWYKKLKKEIDKNYDQLIRS